ncbi:hypothetical protein SUGI_0126470 [Cryptomeria japonica]|nr:hypothetical protein SUGI_0126470 [Cryptomeria japonica]
MEDSPTLGKRKAEENVDGKSNTSHEGGDVPGEAVQADPKRRNLVRTCIHEVAIPSGYVSTVDETLHGSISDPSYKGPMAKTYPFTLDPFQQVSVACLERNESVLVSAHTSAGKTAVAEYAIAMAFRDKQRVIYTSPLKALSNQKYRELSQEFSDVGLMTGDVSLSPNATCLVMTTEILRGMLYRGSELLKEVAWVIFDEIHYMKDRERGVVWEEKWICKLHSQPCHVVYTDFRPTPLQHYAFPIGGSGLYLVVDEKEQFREDNFMKLQEVFPKKIMDDGLAPAKNGLGLHGNAKGGSKGAKPAKAPGGDIYRIVKMIMEKKFQPVIIFSFSRRECEQHALSIMSKLDFNSEEEKQDVEQVFQNAILCLNEEDRNLPAVELMLPMLRRGIAVHHSGLLPIIKELVELLFQEGLVKALFATETFAMGLNMPAKTVVFTQLRKFDGDNHRWMASGEYIQMSGRAGRRGKDERGISIIIVDEQMEMKTCKEMIMGKPAPLVSTFRLSYYTLLNLMSRAEGQFDQEYVIKNSFHQFQHEKALPEVEARVSKLEQEAAILDASEEAALAEYHKLRLHISQLEKQMMHEISRPERVLLFLVPGRLVKVRDGVTEWGWGVIVNTVKKPPASGILPSTILTNRTSSYLVDTLLHCTSTMTSDGPRPKPRPALPGQKGEMHVVPVQLPLICSLSALRVAIPQDLRPPEARQSVLMAVQELEKRFPKGLPKLDPIEDMGIDDPDFVKIVKEVEETEQKLLCHPMHKSEQDENQYKSFQRKAELNNEAHQLRLKMRESQLHKFREELRNRSRVLKRLGHIDADGVVQLKGRAACFIDTGDELLATELMFNGIFNELDHHQVASLASCFIPCDKSNDVIHLSKELEKPLQQLQDSARRIAEVQRECKLDVNPEEYVESISRPYLMDIIYHWSKGASFAEVTSRTDVFEGSIIRTTRRLEEFLNQLKAAANAIGDAALEKKFEASSGSIRHGIIFANSLYL